MPSTENTTLSDRIKRVLELDVKITDEVQNWKPRGRTTGTMFGSGTGEVLVKVSEFGSSGLIDIIRELLAANRGLADALCACANDLDETVDGQYSGIPTTDYPSMERAYKRDLAPVISARQALSQYAVEVDDANNA